MFGRVRTGLQRDRPGGAMTAYYNENDTKAAKAAKEPA